VREEGIAIDPERTFEGITGLAVPIRNFQGKVVASLGVCFISSAVDSREMKRIISEAQKMAREVSKEIGCLSLLSSEAGTAHPPQAVFS
jgi:DNA-binding IclR family transcriptional regulator